MRPLTGTTFARRPRLGILTVALAAAALAVLPTGSWALEPGDADPTFDGDGIVITQFEPGFVLEQAVDVAVLPDGRIVAAGLTGRNHPRGTIVLYRPDGTLDPTFGEGGRVLGPEFRNTLWTSTAVQPDSKILVAGDPGVARYSPSGTPDPSFSSDGVADVSGVVWDLALQLDGRIVVVGGDFVDETLFVARLLPTGEPDPAFGSEGVVEIPSADQTSPEAVLIHPNGRILVLTNAPDGPRVVAVRPDGSLDPDFGDAGVVKLPIDPGRLDAVAFFEFATGLALQGDHIIVALGNERPLVRLTQSGEVDAQFLSESIGLDRRPREIAVDPAGDIVATIYLAPTDDVAIARFTADGKWDPSFGANGLRVFAIPASQFLDGLAIQADGKVVAAGVHSTTESDGDFLVVRVVGSTLRVGGDQAMAEPGGAAALPFTVSLDHAVAEPVTVTVTTANESATSGTDYSPVNQTFAFAPGDTSRTIDVPIQPDNVPEGDESFVFNITTTTTVPISVPTARGTILDNDGPLRWATGAGPGGGPHVRSFFQSLPAGLSFYAYDPRFTGGVRVARGDVDGDGTNDIITAPGPGGGPHIKVFDGTDGSVIGSFMAFDPFYTGGVWVAAADIDADGRSEVVASPGANAGPVVSIFNGLTGAERTSFFAYDLRFEGGVRVAGGDVNADGRDDIITAPGPGGGPHVRVFSGVNRSELMGFMAYDPGFTGGVFVASGDVNGDGRSDVITGPGAGGGPHVRVWNGSGGGELHGFYAYHSGFTGGVHVGATDANIDGRSDILTGPGAGGGPHARIWSGATFAELTGLFAYDPRFTGGVFIG